MKVQYNELKEKIEKTNDRRLLEWLEHRVWLKLVSLSKLQTIENDHWESEPIANLHSLETLKKNIMEYLEYLHIDTLENVEFLVERNFSLKASCIHVVVQSNLPVGKLPLDLIENLSGFR